MEFTDTEEPDTIDYAEHCDIVDSLTGQIIDLRHVVALLAEQLDHGNFVISYD